MPISHTWRSTLLAVFLVPLLAMPSLTGQAQGPGGLPTTLSQVLSVTLPPRDILELARRLNGVQDIPAPPSIPAETWQIGDTATFWVDNLETDRKFQVQTTLRYMNDSVYMWVQSDANIDQAALERSAETFSTTIYPIVHEAFGTEPLPGVDGDPRLYIVHAADLGAGVAAYFGGDSLHPPEALSTSNGHEMFFVNLDTMRDSIGTDYYDGVLAHEFQHMVHWNHDANEPAWLDEGMAELSSLLTGHDRRGFIAQFLSQPATQLNTWPDEESTLPHYGASFMFTAYLYERFGAALIRSIIDSEQDGLEGIDAALAEAGLTDAVSDGPLTSIDVFADWVVANLLNAPDLADGRFGYTLLDPTLGRMDVNNTVKTYPTAITTATPQYSASAVSLDHMGPGRLRLDFTGAEAVRLVPTDAFSGQRMWYSNRGDTTDSTLTRTFDLRGVKQAALEFMLWYDIEDLWDYAYVMASIDGGATWTALSTAHTTTDDPHHNSYGPGYTGESGGPPARWVAERIDLTPFAGREVMIRFELITDEAVNTPGMVIDDVAIPAIGYFDDFENGMGGWESDGWLYIDNVLPQQWIVQMIRQAGETEITRLLMPTDRANSGSWEFDIGGPAGRVMLVFSPVAPVTTEPGEFSYTLTRVE